MEIFNDETGFQVDLTNRPDTLNLACLKGYDVILSNWNSWPENELRWPKEMEEGLLTFLNEGGGLLFFHASTSVFYEWPAFQEISTAAWVKETHHGENCPVVVSIGNRTHPITEGLRDFFIFDELWIEAGQNPTFEVLGTASPADDSKGTVSPQPALFVSNYGQGRIFHTLLGHDARALRNTGLKTILQRAAVWAARAEVEIPVPPEMMLPGPAGESSFSWIENDSTCALLDKNKVIWQFNFNNKHGKPYFHPVYLNGERITCLSPDDHPWHLGQWFSWKYLNGVNFWEYTGDSFKSGGTTSVREIHFEKHADFAATIGLQVDYLLPGGAVVLKEHRTIHIKAPARDRIAMDYSLEFRALENEVFLDRTPIEGEHEGKPWGGYAGLSLRFNQDFMEPNWQTASGFQSEVNGSRDEWLYMGFKGLHGTQVGSAIFISKNSRRKGEAWYLIDQPEQPFFYISPAYLYLEPLVLPPHDQIRLNYRILHLRSEVSSQMLQSAYQEYCNDTK